MAGVDARSGRGRRLIGVALAVAAAICLLIALPDFYGLLPGFILRRPIPWFAAALVATWAIARCAGRARFAAVAAFIDELDRGAASLAGGPWPERIVGALIVLAVAGWLPHYLTWPLWRDADTFAALARGWDLGVRPYRDVVAYNLPGQTYLWWLIGKTVGWGRPRAFAAADAMLLLAFFAGLVMWSRRLFGRSLPGLVGAAGFAWIYMGLPYNLVAQRDWQAAALATLSVMTAECTTGPRGRAASALLFALSATLRPHVVLFVPAVLCALDEARHATGRGPGASCRAGAEWGAMAGAFLGLVYAPLWAQGLFGDLVRNLSVVAYGGPYSRATPATMTAELIAQLHSPEVQGLLVGLVAALIAPWDRRRAARTWLVALLGVLMYRPLHPMPHDYLRQPLCVAAAPALGVIVAAVLGARFHGVPKLLAVAVLIHQAMPGMPWYWDPTASVQSIGPLIRGLEPSVPPPGCRGWVPSAAPNAHYYGWPEYLALVAHLRRTTAPTAEVANLLKRVPHPSLNAPTGRPSPFRVEGGLLWMWFIRRDVDAELAADLERAGPDSVVVWAPDEADLGPRLNVPRTFQTVRRLYRFDARFGRMEVWRRRESAQAGLPGRAIGASPGSSAKPSRLLRSTGARSS